MQLKNVVKQNTKKKRRKFFISQSVNNLKAKRLTQYTEFIKAFFTRKSHAVSRYTRMIFIYDEKKNPVSLVPFFTDVHKRYADLLADVMSGILLR